MSSVISVRGLKKSYGSTQAVAGIDLSIAQGEIFALLGPNGAGKTTTVEILEGFRTRDSGEVSVLNTDPAVKGEAGRIWRNRIGIVLQSTSDAGDLSVKETVAHFAKYYANPRDVDEVVNAVGLAEKSKELIRTLSGGQRRRLDVALGIIGSPELLFLDEPTTGFDPKARRAFWALIEDLRKTGTTILLTTHYLDEAEALADRVAVINRGVIVEVSTPALLGGRATSLATVAWLGAGGPQSERTDNPTALIKKLTESFKGEIPELTVRRASLEDIYLEMIGGADESNKVPGALSIGIARGGLEIKQFMRQRESVVFTLAFPIMLLAIFGSVFTNELTDGVTFSQYFVAGMIASGLVNTGFQQLAIMIPVERDFGTLKRLRGTPMPASSYFIGKAIVVLVTMAIQVLLLLIAGVLFFGVNLPTDTAKWFTFTWLIILGSATSTALGIAFSVIPKSGRSASVVVSPVVIVLQFFSGVFFVFTDLPAWMQQVAAIFPLKWMTQGMRSVFLPDSFETSEVADSWETGRTFIIIFAWFIAGLVISIRTFKWDRQK